MAARADEDVLRLDVAVRHAGGMRAVERLGDRHEQPHGVLAAELARDDEVLERAAADEPHREEQPLVRLAGLVDGDDVRMVDRGLELSLAAKAGAEDGVLAEVRVEDLQRDRALERQLRRLVDDAHPAAPEHRLDAVAGNVVSGLHRDAI